MNPIELKCELCEIDLDGMTLDEAIAELNEIKADIKPGFTRVVIELKSWPEYAEFKLYGYRPETAEETAKRVELERAKDAAEFERLRNKLGVKE